MYLIKLIFMIGLLCLTQNVLALKSDSQQPITIDSNTASYNEEKGVSIYTGNVVTIQGSLHINSNKLVIYLRNGDIYKMVFTGKPAKFRQLPGKGKEEIHGEGLTGEYYPNKNKLILIEQAVVRQGNNQSASRIIVYDSRNALIQAGEKSSDAKRVHSVFKPKAKPKFKAKIESEKNQ